MKVDYIFNEISFYIVILSGYKKMSSTLGLLSNNDVTNIPQKRNKTDNNIY